MLKYVFLHTPASVVLSTENQYGMFTKPMIQRAWLKQALLPLYWQFHQVKQKKNTHTVIEICFCTICNILQTHIVVLVYNVIWATIVSAEHRLPFFFMNLKTHVYTLIRVFPPKFLCIRNCFFFGVSARFLQHKWLVIRLWLSNELSV